MPDIYSMSDEELAQLDFNSLEATQETEQEEEEETPEDQPEETEEATETEADNAESETEVEDAEAETEETETEVEDSTPETTETVDAFDNATEGTQEQADKEVAAESEDDTKADDKPQGKSVEELQKFYDDITAEFKANGKTMSISNPSDIKALVQQGINYSKRMAEMKPGMGILRTLEQHGLMDNDKLSYLIDLHNKDPKAIAKLVKDSGIEAYDLENEDVNDYVPVNKVQEESKFQEVVSELNDSPKFAELLSTVSNSWDKESQSFVVNNPGILRVLNDQLNSGEYAKIVDAVEYERLCGRMRDISFIQAYSIVEQKMEAGKVEKKEAAPVITGTRPKSKTVDNSSKKRKVAAPNSGTTTQEKPFDPLTVSDEEIMRIAELHKLY